MLEAGAEVNITGRVAGTEWYRVVLDDGNVGYLHGALLASTAPETVATATEQSTAAPTLGAVLRDSLRSGGEGPEMIFIKGGCFQMGSPESEDGHGNDERQHRVCIEKDFYIGKYEVTFADYDRFAEATGREKPDDQGWGRGNRPVIDVSWHGAIAYLEWLSEQTGQRYRLPSEAEWEYAARAGTQTAYWWGDEIGSNRANCDGCGSRWDSHQTAPVGSFPANPWGLHDTVGNVWEWTCSGYDESYGGAEGECISKNNAST
jgi:formylglycine-generating enzyme required for sulfatase activity